MLENKITMWSFPCAYTTVLLYPYTYPNTHWFICVTISCKPTHTMDVDSLETKLGNPLGILCGCWP